MNVNLRLEHLEYRYIFIVEDRNHWESCKSMYDNSTDLVLSIDFGLKKEMEQNGCAVQYLDHLLDSSFLEGKNYEMHKFLNGWYRDEKGKDIFEFEGMEVGNAFLLNILNDVTYNVHFFLSILALRKFSYRKIICAVTDVHVIQWLKELKYDVDFQNPPAGAQDRRTVYFFPIVKWMQSRIERKSGKEKLKALLLRIIDYALILVDFFSRGKKPMIFIQSYYPTKKIIELLKRDGRIRLLLVNYTSLKGLLAERRISARGASADPRLVTSALTKFEKQRKAKWLVEEYDISAFLYRLLEPKLPQLLQRSYSRLIDIRKYLRNKDLKLMVPVTDLWMENRLIMNYCKKEGIPVYMIINGLLTHNFVFDGRDVDIVNAYGDAIKEDYFFNKENIVCLGDPRMDYYAKQPLKTINRERPTVIIGAAGYSPIDLNSYLAYEFEFLFDLLDCFNTFAEEGRSFEIIIKVRANGYTDQYERFIKEYFPGSNITIIQDMPFATLISKADLYISFYSQTLFEASSLGIPSLYYKNDRQVINKPFDSRSELVTANNKHELKEKILLFLEGDVSFQQFTNKKVLEKYIGPMDGNNAERNVDFIYKLLNQA